MLRPFFFTTLLLAAYSMPQASPPSSTNILSGIMNAFSGKNSLNATSLLSVFQMPSCLRECLPHIDRMSKSIATESTDVDMKQVCKDMQTSSLCAAKAGCPPLFMDAVTNIFQFTCLDNIDSLGQLVVCAKSASDNLQQECESHCGVQSGIIEKAQRSQLEEMFDMSSICNSTVCLFHCFKARISTKCMAQNNVLETMLNSVLRGEGEGFDDVLTWAMPDICKNKGIEIKPVTDSTLNIPLSVGGTPRIKKMVASNRVFSDSDGSYNYFNGSMETALLIDEQVRTLRCNMVDVEGNPAPMPDFQSFARIMAEQIVPLSMPTERTFAPSESDFKNAEDRIQYRAASEEDDTDLPVWRGENSDLIVPQNGVVAKATSFVCVLTFLALVLH